MSRIAGRFAALKREGRGALISYLQAYDPDRDTSLAILRGMPGAGADLIEIGVPFSDPMADGPTIQAAALRGLKAGATLAGVLDLVRAFREGDLDTPIILMGYVNPIESYGVERFCADAAQAGVDGLIVVDLPPEEAALLHQEAAAHDLDLIRLIAPTTDPARLGMILRDCTGFVYYVSIAGITGTHSASETHLAEALPRLRQATDLPIAVGFGIRTREQVLAVWRHADAAVVASELIKTLASNLDEQGKLHVNLVKNVLNRLRLLTGGDREC